jgi:hypothetical protein
MPAPKGNLNALKHGLYARNFLPDETDALRRMTFDNLLYEIAGCRTMAEKAMRLVYRHMSQPDPDSDKVVPLLNAWNASVRSIALLALRYTTLTGDNPSFTDSLAEALAGVPLYEPDPDLVRK